mmetsp:Transcript_26868/g.63126  ORF Transcript_26868/g.63126 Transcript_26868/m.63126 type:complete len:683 (+) Transcript_26868:88-2136(+)|eukprot:CAMPEP_0197180338 /NCGR_PEP_ID=MMETSP1423-20130617/4986_1 /TAXON_ID=476441 /ORGANISM="Pseudo-nitzschia heimii, Strain UNC1101" /LENGTH=682 /DNA_ID=CAMNT_0042630407 /DNA_START=47 /DNA_END=2095 /DNA_ORIENTATION=+
MGMVEEKVKNSLTIDGSESKDGSKPSKKKNKKSRKRQRQPKPGDPDYKTPTQLRNARKRRKKKQDKVGASAATGNGCAATKSITPESGRKNTPKSATGSSSSSYGSINDPSLKYLSNPKAAPTVRNAIKFFREKTNAQAGTNHNTYFPVTLGAKLGWRTVARLAVRVRGTTTADGSHTGNDRKVRIGLFVPGSHELLPVPNCPVHNHRINELVKVLEDVCNTLKVPTLDDESEGGNQGSKDNFGLRYIAISVERSTQKQQLVLVWKEPSLHQRQEDGEEDKQNASDIIEKLVKNLVGFSRDKTKKDVRLHSIWVHYNNSWKHSNSIFDREGRWETRFVDGETKATAINNSVGSDPLRGAIQETMLPLYTKKRDGKSGNANDKNNDTTDGNGSSSNTSNEIYVPLYFPPQVFRQANLDGFAKIILRIREWLHQKQSMGNAALSHSPAFSESQKRIDEKATSQPPKRKRRRGKRDTSNAGHKKEEEEQDQYGDTTKTPLTTRLSVKNSPKTFRHCLELYGGVGTIGLNLIDYFDSLDSSDENPFNEACFNTSADNIKIISENKQKTSLDPSKRSNITYTSKSASEIVVDQYDSLKKSSVVVVDPPRKGLDPPVIEALCSDYYPDDSQQQQQHLVYVSCGFDAFRRDYRALVEHSGKWTLDSAEGHLLFPGSDAIETLAFFTRAK